MTELRDLEDVVAASVLDEAADTASLLARLGIPYALVGGLALALMMVAFWPTLRLYQASPLWALLLPLAGLLYTLMTISSAQRHWAGRGAAWKGRSYSELRGSGS